MVQSSKSTSPDEGLPSHRGTTILVVDDDDDLRSALADNLRDDGYRVLEFRNPTELPSLDSMGEVTALITDYQMAEQDGIALADRFHARYPNTVIVLITAYWSAHLDAEAARRKYLHLCRKPFDYDDLQALLDSGSGVAS